MQTFLSASLQSFTHLWRHKTSGFVDVQVKGLTAALTRQSSLVEFIQGECADQTCLLAREVITRGKIEQNNVALVHGLLEVQRARPNSHHRADCSRTQKPC